MLEVLFAFTYRNDGFLILKPAGDTNNIFGIYNPLEGWLRNPEAIAAGLPSVQQSEGLIPILERLVVLDNAALKYMYREGYGLHFAWFNAMRSIQDIDNGFDTTTSVYYNYWNSGAVTFMFFQDNPEDLLHELYWHDATSGWRWKDIGEFY